MFSLLQLSKICPGFQLIFKTSAPAVRYKDNNSNLCSGNKPVILPFIITEALYKLMEKYMLWLHISKCKLGIPEEMKKSKEVSRSYIEERIKSKLYNKAEE